jgi:phosphatidylserine decarboxylase
MVIFSIALFLLCVTISNTPTRGFVTVMTALVAALIAWCILTAWKSTEDYDVWRKSLAALRRTRGDVFKGAKELFQDVLRSISIRRAPGDVHSIHSMTDRPFAYPVPGV